MRPLLVLAAMLMFTGPVFAEDKDSEGIAILRVAMEKEKDPAAMAEALTKLDDLVKKQPKQADAHYARGWVLSRIGKPDDAVAAYDKAFALDKRLADAAYNAGVVLARAGKQKEAVARFDKALTADPKHVDAAYNAGQGYYDLKQFAKAAQRWTAAQKITPNDFNTAKKLLQAYMALGKAAEAARARDKVFALKKAATDPGLVKMKSFVFDQFDVGKFHIFVYEAFDTSGDLAYVYQFQVTENDKPIGSVNLETSAVIREQGVPFLLGMDKGDKHTTFSDKGWKTLPAYKDVKVIAVEKIKASF